jgi:hypothetical protein
LACARAGGGIAYNVDEFKEIVEAGISASLTNQARAYSGCMPGLAPFPQHVMILAVTLL